jgi:alpha-amylase
MKRCHPFILVLAGLLSYSLAHTQPVPLTFKVDMSMETLSPNGVHVAGNFQEEAGFGNDWTPNATMLSDMNGDDIYEITVMVPAGTYQYKFINGDSWGDKPELPSADCAINDGGGNFNRQVTVGSQELSIPVVQFDSCNARLQLAVNMNMETISSEGVHVMGNFQEAAGYPANWAPDAIPMEDSNDDGVYEVSIQVPPGTYEYVFVNGNTDVASRGTSLRMYRNW